MTTTIDWDFFYPMSSGDITGLIFGGFTGLGYAATLFLPDCKDAGLEMGASALMVYQWWVRDYTIYEKIIGPIPDYVQLIVSAFYMFTCVTNSPNTDLATALVFYAKYFQALFLPYVYVTSYLQGSRHDTFVAAYALMKQIFNIVDSTNYVLGSPLDAIFI